MSAKTQHFLFLDGLRGVAALLVVLLHWFDGHGIGLLGSSLLAVDYFFMLSGFVVTHAYQEKMRAAPDFTGFMTKRIIRLYPIIVLGFALGFVRVSLLAWQDGSSDVEGALFVELLRSLVLIPKLTPEVADFFSLNGPLWSLHYEFIAYIAFGLVLCRLRSRWLWALVLAALPGVMMWAARHFGSDMTIMAVAGENAAYYGGLSRIAFAFTLGVLVYKGMALWSRVPLPAGRWLALTLVVPLVLPRDLLTAAGAVVTMTILFPLILAVGARVEDHPLLNKLDTVLGNLSYPLYALHVPIMWTMSGAFKTLSIGFTERPILNGLVILPVTIAASYLAFVLYDRPLRRLLTRWLHAPPKGPSGDLQESG